MMTTENSDTMDELETIIAIPPLPFRAGSFDRDAHHKNMRYLVERNFLKNGRRRAIGIAGTSLVHHVDDSTLLDSVQIAGAAAGQNAILIAGLVATPPASARQFVQRCMALTRPPDYILLMPIPGVCNPDGIKAEFGALAQDCGERFGARFLLYMRSSDLMTAFADLLSTSPHIFGVKIGTSETDLGRMRAAVPADKQVLWGVGDRATQAARLGSRGHTSGITLICPKVCDEIHNAYFAGDFESATKMEQLVAEFEDIRFMESRAYNYSAVVAAAQIGGFSDVDLGEAGPFNAAPPPPIMSRLERCMDQLVSYH